MRILIVEDEALVAMESEALLTEAGHEVVGVADDLPSALAVLVHDLPELALVDIQLAGRASGLEVAAALKARGVVSLFATGNCPTETGRELALGCLHKPFDERNLVGAVEAARAVLNGQQPQAVPRSMHLY